MTSKERVLAAMQAEEVDRVPVIPIARDALPGCFGLTIEEANVPAGRALIELRGLAVFGYDGVHARLYNDADVEALGGTVEKPDRALPRVIPPRLIEDEGDLDRLAMPVPEESPPLRAELELVCALAREVGETHAVVGYVQGPARLAAQMMGTERFLAEMITNPPFANRLMAFAVEVSAERGRAQMKAGAAIVYLSDPTASGDLISPEFYRELVLPHQQEMVRRLRDAGLQHIILHMCGNTTRVLADMAATGADVLSLDKKVNLATAREQVGTKVCLMGNVDPVGTMLRGRPEDVLREGRECIARAGRAAFILSTGCTCPPDTRAANIAALVEAAREG